MSGIRLCESIWQDMRYALRTMRQQPIFTATAVLTLALAIGGTTAMFTVIDAVLLKPLPYPDSDQLVNIYGGATPARFELAKATARSYTEIAAYTGEENETLSTGGEPEVLKGVRVSANFLRILGIEPLLGRSFRNEEDTSGGAPVAMISAALWRRRFGGDEGVLGKTALLGGTAYTVIGVLPEQFAFPHPEVDVWLTSPKDWPMMPIQSRTLSPFLNVFGRLKPGVTVAQANAEAKVIQHQYMLEHPAMLDAKPGRPLKVTEMKDGLVADVRSMLWMMLGAVGFVLLIACANVASLLMARAMSRAREMAVRAALGAGRVRLMRQLIAESVVLSIAGGTLGVVLAVWSLRGIRSMTFIDLRRAQEIHLSWTVLGFVAVVSIGTGILFGIIPAVQASQVELDRVLRMSGAAAQQSARRWMFGGVSLRGVLLVMQVALSIVLLIGTALMIESVSKLRGVAVGFNPENVLTANVSLAPNRYDTSVKRALFFDDLVERLRATPGIRSASASMFLPMMDFAGTPVQDASKPLMKLNERLIATAGVVTPGYFGTLGIALLRGRDFTARDKDGTQRVAVIDETFARHFWPDYPGGLDPIGQHIWVGGVNPNPAEIVGIVANIRQALAKTLWPETVYTVFAQNPQPFAMIAVRTEGPPVGYAGALREQVRALDRNQSISQVRTMEDLVDRQVGQKRLLAMLLGSFALMALLLVLMGLYGVIAYSVVQRTQEVGIRRALGAQQSDILGLIVGMSFRLALVGVVLGIAGAFGLTRLLKDLLFQVSATDPMTFAVVASLFLVVATAASYFPARQANKIDPVKALRL